MEILREDSPQEPETNYCSPPKAKEELYSLLFGISFQQKDKSAKACTNINNQLADKSMIPAFAINKLKIKLPTIIHIRHHNDNLTNKQSASLQLQRGGRQQINAFNWQ